MTSLALCITSTTNFYLVNGQEQQKIKGTRTEHSARNQTCGLTTYIHTYIITYIYTDLYMIKLTCIINVLFLFKIVICDLEEISLLFQADQVTAYRFLFWLIQILIFKLKCHLSTDKYLLSTGLSLLTLHFPLKYVPILTINTN